jgi:subtilase family serine protease
MTVSYGACELALGTAGNSLENQTFQQAATAGISSFVASGDSGSAVCTSQNGTPPYADSYGLAVSGMASNPYVTAVGGTDLQWPFSTNPYTDYWNATNDSKTGASAKGYMPEMSWNDTCTNPFLVDYYSLSSVEEVCNDAISQLPGLVEMGSGSGGVSNCTTNSTTASSTTIDPSSCSGGYAKPSWQKGVTGIPVDGKRDIPDVSMFAAYGFQSSTGIPGSALLICESVDTTSLNTNGCDYSDPDYIIYQENGGTSAASPLTAGIMAMVVQKTGKAQGLANPVFYSLAAKENYAACDSNTVAAGNACIFYDTTTGSNAAVCITGDPDCVTSTSGDQAGILSGYSATTGYDLTTGLGSFNVTNLVKAWPTATAPAVTLSPTSLTFTSTNVGATTAAQLVTVKNSGTAALTLTSETITGTNASSFVKSATTCGSSLAAGASCTVSVAFKPLAAGALSATLSIADNATGSPQTAKLSGTGVAVPLVTLSPTSLTFASTNTGSTTAAQLVTVKNSGTAALTLTSETITGTNASSFVKSATTCGSSLAAGASCTVSVAFKPLAAGALTAALSIADNATGSPQTAKLSGTGVAASGVTVTPSSIAFPATVAGVASDAQIVTVKNTGSVAATLNSIVLGGLGASSFQQIGTCGKTLAAGASCSLYVAFKPASAAALSATITVTDSVVGSPEKVTLTGTGTAAPTVKLSAKSLSFPTTPHGTTSAAQAITLTNSGTATLSLSSITLTGTNPADFEALDTCGATLVPAANCTVYVAFKPAAAAAYKATLSIADSGASSPQTVALSGTGN